MRREPQPQDSGLAIQAIIQRARRALETKNIHHFSEDMEVIERAVSVSIEVISDEAPARIGEYWPPLESVIQGFAELRPVLVSDGFPDYFFEYRRRTARLLRLGIRSGATSLSRAMLSTFTQDYITASRIASAEARAGIVGNTWVSIRNAVDVSPEGKGALGTVLSDLPFELEMQLEAAMVRNLPRDYEGLVLGFRALVRWDAYRGGLDDGEPDLPESDALRRYFRIALLGLAGRAITLQEAGRLTAAQPYLLAASREYDAVLDLASDLGAVLDYPGDRFRWSWWESEEQEELVAAFVDPFRYPMTAALSMIIARSDRATPRLDALGGHADRIRVWTEHHVELIRRWSAQVASMDDARTTFPFQTAYARFLDGLGMAERLHEAADEQAAIDAPLLVDRVDDLITDLYSTRHSFMGLERLFRRAGAWAFAQPTEEFPPSRGTSVALPRQPFVGGAGWGMPLVHSIGPSFEEGTYDELRKGLADLPTERREISSPEDIVRLARNGLAELGWPEHALIILDGEFVELMPGLYRQPGYESGWHLRQELGALVEGTVDGRFVLWHPSPGRRQIYVLSLPDAGCLVRSPAGDGGEDLAIRLREIGEEEARTLLENPGWFGEEADSASRLRKIRSLVVLEMFERVGFLAGDLARGRAYVDERVRERASGDG